MAKKTAAKKPAVTNLTKTASPAPAVEAVNKVHPLVKFFVAFHLIAITLYALPKPSDDVLNGKVPPRGSDLLLSYNFKEIKQTNIIYGYLYPTGFWQYWDMFAPDPAQTDTWCDAVVTYLDGSTKTYQYPRIKEQSIPKKYVMERYRKYFERVNQENWPFFWPPFAQAIALKNATDPGNPPVKVALTRHFQQVMRHDHQTPTEPPYGSYNFFTYYVDQQKLFSDKGWKLGIH